MTEPLDIEYVEIRARGEDKAAHDIVAALKRLAAEIKKLSAQFEHDIKDSFEDAADESMKKLAEIGPTAAASFKEVAHEARQTGEKTAAAIIAGVRLAKNSIDDLADDATRDFNRIQREAVETGAAIAASMAATRFIGRARVPVRADVDIGRVGLVSRALGGIGSVVRGGLSVITGLLGNISRLFVKVGEDGTKSMTALGKSITGVVSVLGSLGGALASFAAANPLITLLIVLSPAIFAVIGALGQLWALLLLIPGAILGVVAVIAPLILAFQGFGEAVSAVASGDLDKIREAMRNLPPAMRHVVTETAGLRDEFGRLKKTIQQNFFKPLVGDVERLGTTLLPVLNKGLGRIAGALGRMVDGFLRLVENKSILELLDTVFSSVARSVDKFAGPLTTFLGVLAVVAKESLPFLERIGDAFGDMLDGISKFLSKSIRTGKFQKFLEDAFRITRELVDLFKAFGGYVTTIFGAGKEEGEDFIVSLTDIFNRLNEFFKSPEGQKALDTFYEGVKLLIIVLELSVPLIKKVAIWGTRLIEFFKGASGAAQTAAGAISGFFGSVGDFFGRVAGIFQELPGKVMGFLQSLPGMVSGIFTNLFENVGYIVGFGAGLVVRTFTELPGRVSSGAAGLIGRVKGIFTQTTSGAVSLSQSLVNRVIGWFQKLPGRAVSAIQSLPGKISSIFRAMVSRASQFGLDIVRGIVNGVKKLRGWAIEQIQNFADGLVKGFKKALHIGSPSKRAAEEVGKPISQGIGLGMAEEGNSLLRTMTTLTRGLIGRGAAVAQTTTSSSGGETSINMENGAVQVVFQGVVPTQREAFETGKAVGQGIIATLARRGVRTAVRTV